MRKQRRKQFKREERQARYNAADVSDKLILNLRDLGHIMRRQYEGKASQKRILIVLYREGTTTQSALTERLGVQPGTASEVLAKLESAGLIQRDASAVDRRTMDIRLTEAGTAAALEAVEQRQNRHKAMFEVLSDEEKLTLLGLLEKLNGDWELRFSDGENSSPPCKARNNHISHHGTTER
ncbi:MAG: MarR family transcriptional regulator [Clostridia bacterium]|nr:MarR family transcriptional regulator [Clostridia bacterium]